MRKRGWHCAERDSFKLTFIWIFNTHPLITNHPWRTPPQLFWLMHDIWMNKLLSFWHRRKKSDWQEFYAIISRVTRSKLKKCRQLLESIEYYNTLLFIASLVIGKLLMWIVRLVNIIMHFIAQFLWRIFPPILLFFYYTSCNVYSPNLMTKL